MSSKQSFKTAFQTRAFKNGGYSILITTAVVVIAILVNALIAALPSSIIRPSISPYDYYSLSDLTKDLVGGISDPITLNYVVTAGGEDEVLVEFAKRYCELSEHLKLKMVDPTASPAFVDQYSEAAGGNLSENSIVVVNETTGEARVVLYEEVFGRTFASQEEYYYYMMGMDVGTKYFAGENEMTSALEYVTMEFHPTIYQTAGHGEAPFGESMTQVLDGDNYVVKELNLLTTTELDPKNTVVYINSPTKDFAESEVNLLRDYMKKGGKVLLMSDYSVGDLPLLYGLMKEYGMGYKPGVVVEGNSSHYISQPTILLPNVTASDIAALMQSDNINILLPLAHAIDNTIQIDVNEFKTTVLMNTSNAAYIKIPTEDNPDMTMEKEEGDEVGSFPLACMTKNSAGGAAIWFATPFFTEDTFMSYNYEYLLCTLGYLSEKEASVSIATKTLADENLVVSAGAQGVWALILMAVIPLGTLVFGIRVWNKRRKQ